MYFLKRCASEKDALRKTMRCRKGCAAEKDALWKRIPFGKGYPSKKEARNRSQKGFELAVPSEKREETDAESRGSE